MATKEASAEKRLHAPHGRTLTTSAATPNPVSSPLQATRDTRSTSSIPSPRAVPARDDAKISRAASTITTEEVGANTGTGAPMGLPWEWMTLTSPPPPPKKERSELPILTTSRKAEAAAPSSAAPTGDRPDSADRASGRTDRVVEKKKKKHLMREMEDLHAQLEEMRSKLQAKNAELETLQTKWWRNTGTDPNTEDQVRSIQASSACANASAGKEDNLKTMLQYGADIHLANGDGRTPLHFAASAGHGRVVAFLLESGAQMDVRDVYGRTAFDDACRTKQYHVVQTLDEAQAMRQFKAIEKEYKLSDYIVVGKEDIKPKHETMQLQRQLSKLTRFFGEAAGTRATKGSVLDMSELPAHVSSPQLGRNRLQTVKDKHAAESASSSSSASQPHLNHKAVEFAKDQPAALSSSATSGGSSISSTSGDGSMTVKQRKRENRKSAKGLRRILDWRPFGSHSHPTDGDGGNNSESHRAGPAPYGIAFGRLRGACQADDCHCTSFHNDNSVPGVTVCTCKHFPATHLDLGEANILESSHLLAGLEHLNIVDESSTELLLEKEPGVAWPKVLNTNLENDEISKYFSTVSRSSDVVVDARDVEFLRKLGQGASATVYEGTHMGKPVAIKMIDFFPTPKRSLEKIQHEMVEELRVMSALSDVSDNVVHYYGVITQPRFCILLEFCPHGALTDVLSSPRLRMDWSRFFEWAKQITRGVLDLHSWNPPIVHRDLKTLNLLVDADYRVKVADFGLSRFLADDVSQSTLGRMRGTYAYTDPEIYDGIKFSAKADMFSMGIIMWELVYRTLKGEYQRPYAEYPFMNRDFQIIIQVARKNVRPTIPENCPDLLAQVLKSLWTRVGDDRPDAMELLSTLESINAIYEQNRDTWDLLLPPLPPISDSDAGSRSSSLKLPIGDSSSHHGTSSHSGASSSSLGAGSDSLGLTPLSGVEGFSPGTFTGSSVSPRSSPLGASSGTGILSQLKLSNTQNSVGTGVGSSLSPRGAGSSFLALSGASSQRSGSATLSSRVEGASSPPASSSPLHLSPHTSPRTGAYGFAASGTASSTQPIVTFHPATPAGARIESPGRKSPRSNAPGTFDRAMSSNEGALASHGKHKRSKSGAEDLSHLLHASSTSSIPVSSDPVKKKHTAPASEKDIAKKEKDKGKTPKPEKKKKDKA